MPDSGGLFVLLNVVSSSTFILLDRLVTMSATVDKVDELSYAELDELFVVALSDDDMLEREADVERSLSCLAVDGVVGGIEAELVSKRRVRTLTPLFKSLEESDTGLSAPLTALGWTLEELLSGEETETILSAGLERLSENDCDE